MLGWLMGRDKDLESIDMMKANIDDDAAVKEGLKYIAKEAYMDDNINNKAQDRRKEMMGKGAGIAVLNGMRRHTADHDIQHHGCRALRNLSLNDINEVILMLYGAHQTIIIAMNNHQDDTSVQYYGCEALVNLSVNDDNKVSLIMIGAGEAILNAMNNHKVNASVQHIGCRALSNLSVNDDNRVTLMKIGAGGVIINAMNNHKGNSKVQYQGCGALSNLLTHRGNQVILMKMGGDEAIINAMNIHKDNTDVQHSGCKALGSLLSSEESISEALKRGLDVKLGDLVENLSNIEASLHKFSLLTKLKELRQKLLIQKSTSLVTSRGISIINVKSEILEKEKQIQTDLRKQLDILIQKLELSSSELLGTLNINTKQQKLIQEKDQQLKRERQTQAELQREIESLTEILKETKSELIDAQKKNAKISNQLKEMESLMKREQKFKNKQKKMPEKELMRAKLKSSSSSRSNDLIKITKTLKMKSEHCEILEKIAEGGFSNVFKVSMRNQSKDYIDIFAFKQFDLSPNVITRGEITTIEREIDMLSKLKHDNIVKIIGAIGDHVARDINNERMGIGIVMEYCENGSLRSLLNKNTNNQQQLLNMNLIIHLLLGVAQGLEYLHDHIPYPIIHGDIKSDNILIDKEYNAKLCDFGISKLQQSSYASSSRVGGTLAYKAPETFTGTMELCSDVYSFGCVILEMLTGERPWNGLGNDVGAIVAKVLVIKEQHDLSKIRTDVKEELVDLMKRCLNYDRDKRPTMNEVRMDLEMMMNNAVLIELNNKSEEYNKVENIFFPGEEDKEGSLNRNNYRIVKIDKVRHPFAERRYDAELSNTISILNNDEGANERLLFHGTRQTDPMEILNHPCAFMKDYSSEGFYGRGLYFAEKARYSHAGYRYNIPNTNQYQMLVCSVICGHPKKYGIMTNKQLTQKDLGTEYHSVHAGPHRPGGAQTNEDDSCMYVVYKDTQVLPKYLIIYESIKQST